MPRRPRPGSRAARSATPRPLGSTVAQRVETRAGRAYVVRSVSGQGAAKIYTCPGCGRGVPSSSGHVVVWPHEARWYEESGPEQRRHWHTACWSRG